MQSKRKGCPGLAEPDNMFVRHMERFWRGQTQLLGELAEVMLVVQLLAHAKIKVENPTADRLEARLRRRVTHRRDGARNWHEESSSVLVRDADEAVDIAFWIDARAWDRLERRHCPAPSST